MHKDAAPVVGQCPEERVGHGIKQVLTGDMQEDEVAPRAAAAWLAHELVREGGGQLQVADGENGMLIIGATLPA